MIENRTSDDDFVCLRVRLKRLHGCLYGVGCTNGAGGQNIIQRRCKMRGQGRYIAFYGRRQLAWIARAQRNEALHQRACQIFRLRVGFRRDDVESGNRVRGIKHRAWAEVAAVDVQRLIQHLRCKVACEGEGKAQGRRDLCWADARMCTRCCARWLRPR